MAGSNRRVIGTKVGAVEDPMSIESEGLSELRMKVLVTRAAGFIGSFAACAGSMPTRPAVSAPWLNRATLPESSPMSGS